jgi:hypothetical protein
LLRRPIPHWIFTSNRGHRRFCANFSRLSEFYFTVKLILFAHSSRSNSLLAVIPEERFISPAGLTPARKSHSAKYQRLTSEQPAPLEPLGLTGINSRVLQWLVL